MTDTLPLEFLSQLAKGLALQFGPQCEVVVHDLRSQDLDHSIVAIENGHVSHRKLGDGPSQVVLEALQGDRSQLEDRFCYLTKTQDGKVLKSSTIYIRNQQGEAIGILSINFDISNLLLLENALHGLTAAEQSQEPEKILPSVNELLDELIEQSVRNVGKPVELMKKEDKIKAIQFLSKTGAFLITKSGDKVSQYFGISKYTLYSYIDAKPRAKK